MTAATARVVAVRPGTGVDATRSSTGVSPEGPGCHGSFAVRAPSATLDESGRVAVNVLDAETREASNTFASRIPDRPGRRRGGYVCVFRMSRPWLVGGDSLPPVERLLGC